MGVDIPKQYIALAGKPILVHTLEQFQRCDAVDGAVVTASPKWEAAILRWKQEFCLSKLLTIAPAGEDRQLSIRNGLMKAEQYMDPGEQAGVIIQDSVRPLASVGLLDRLIKELEDAPAVMPALPITDTTYTSRDGQWVDGLLDRSTLFAGQAPEAFRYWPYWALYRDTSEKALTAMSGSCQLPYSQGWRVKMIPGEQENIKITYPRDLEICEKRLRERKKT